MRQICYDIGGSSNSTFLIDGLNCTQGGSNHSLSSSDDRINFIDFHIICAPEPDQYVKLKCSQLLHNFFFLLYIKNSVFNE